MEEDWDLHAVVRGCTTITSSSTTTTTSSMSSSSAFGTCYQPSTSSSSSCSFLSIFPTEQAGAQVLSHSNSNTFEATSSIEELHDLCKPFFLKPTLHTSSSFSYSSPKSPLTPQKQQPRLDNKKLHLCGSAAAATTTTPRSKRRKNQLKKVCEVEAENLSADIWAWRKYGQKPIKGSPYPRGYYRCSSSKGCLARKQVERKKSDPTMFIVTYTGEHSHPAPTHRNSLAGSTRQKPLTPQTLTAEEDSTKPASPATTSEAEEEEVTLKSEDLDELMNDDEEENDQFGLSDMVVTDDFFEGLDDLTGFDATKTGGDSLADPFAASVALPACGGQ